MHEQFIIPTILLVAGAYFLIRNISYLRNKSKLINYLESSHKGKLWVKKFGIEKVTRFSYKYFLPIGILISLIMLAFAIDSLHYAVINY